MLELAPADLSMRAAIVALCIATMCNVTAPAPADAQPAPIGARREASEPFARGTWSLGVHGGWIADADTDIAQAHVALGFHLFDRMALQLEGSLYDVRHHEQNETAAGLDVLFRYYLVVHAWFGLFIEGGAGLILCDVELPRGTSSWNFTPQARLGTTFEIVRHLHLVIAGGWWHASTAGLGRPNPGFNGVQVLGGLLFAP